MSDEQQPQGIGNPDIDVTQIYQDVSGALTQLRDAYALRQREAIELLKLIADMLHDSDIEIVGARVDIGIHDAVCRQEPWALKVHQAILSWNGESE